MFRTRLITALILMSAFLGALFLVPELYWEALMLVIVCVGAWEWSMLSGLPARGVYVGLTLLAGLLLLPFPFPVEMLAWQQHVQLWTMFAAALFWLLLAPVFLLKQQVPKNIILMACIGWLVLMPTWLALGSLRRVSPFLVLALMATVWIADSAAYFFGKRFGRRKLASHISPGKTWEGVFGALAAVTLYGITLCLAFNLGWWTLVGLWGLTILSVVGDLFESLLKRQAGVKDSGTSLPGHGGVLDRIDGLTSTLPLAAFYAYFPLYIAGL